MIDIKQEQPISLSRAARRSFLPRRRKGKRPHVATLYRWAQRGIRGVRLETIRVGGTLCTSVEAIQRFCDALSGDVNSSATGSSVVKSRKSEAAAAMLAARGI